MGIVIKNSLSNFMTRISKSRANLRKDKLLAKLGQFGVDVANQEYSLTTYKPENVKYEVGENQVSIIANGEKIAYSEYGTGVIGKGSNYPKDKLPTEPITFVSPRKSGDIHTTQGWEYNYPNAKTKIDGQSWYYEGKKTQGEPAKAQMLKTSLRLKEEIPQMLKKKD